MISAPSGIDVHELDDKLARLTRLCHAHQLGGILLTTQANFAWITGGRSNRIDGTREPGAGAIFVTADGRRVVIANTIEMPRLLEEALADIPCEVVEYPWTDDHRDPSTPARLAQRVTSSAASIGADWPIASTTNVARELVRARALLTAAEIDRYRALGRDVGEAAGRVCRSFEPGLSEHEVARRAVDAVASTGARATVTLVAADDRIARFRHPVPTARRWEKLLMLVLCAERDGLVVALTRLIASGRIPSDVESRTEATARVFAQLLDATRPGALGRDVYAAAADAYARAGFPGEETRHHQGGAIGYYARDWLAHPGSEEHIQARQAFAWNPSITGTKVEDTVLLIDGLLETISATPGWPSIELTVLGETVAVPVVAPL